MSTPATRKRKPIWIAVAVAVFINITLGCCWGYYLRKTEKKPDSVNVNRFVEIPSTKPDLRNLSPSKSADPSTKVYSYRQAARTLHDRYDRMVADRRMIQAIARLARDSKDFPVHAGEEIVASSYHLAGDSRTSFWALASREIGPVSMLVYVPPTLQRLSCTVTTSWEKPTRLLSADSRVFEFDVNPGEVNEFTCHVEGSTLHLSLNSESRSEHFPSSFLTSRSPSVFYRRCYPNQRVGPNTGRRRATWKEARMKLNEIFNQSFSLVRNEREGTVNVVCQLESDATESYCVVSVAANSRSFIDRFLVERDYTRNHLFGTEIRRRTVTEVFRRSENSRLLYSRRNFTPFPQSHF